jgi:hypothetical protein
MKLNNQFVEISVSEVHRTLGFLYKQTPNSKPTYRNENWLDFGLEYKNRKDNPFALHFQVMIFEIVDKEKFLWSYLQYGFEYKIIDE